MAPARVAWMLLLGAAACRGPSPPRSACVDSVPFQALELERALPIEGAELEPSGLLVADGRLLMVSDKRDDAVFELTLGERSATASVYLKLAPLSDGPLDLEGLSRDADGSWLLASEAEHRVLRATTGGVTSWVGPSLAEVGKAAGLFGKPNAGVEGITLHGSSLLVAAEREPRGLLESDPERATWRAQAMPGSRCPAPEPRPNDWADLTTWNGRTFGLARNAHLVVELQPVHGAWQEVAAWSYAHAENDARYAYDDRRFGLGEGLAIDAHHVYVVLDNNRTARAAAPGDHRPLLFIFERPF